LAECGDIILGDIDRKTEVQASPGKLVRPYLKNKLGEVCHSCNPSYSGGGS
jgi:hypothetical protein